MTSITHASPTPERIPLWSKPLRLIRQHARVYALLNLGAYGLFAVGFAVGLVFPDLNTARAQALENDGTGELVRGVFDNPLLFAALILAVNVFRLSLLTIIVPSVIIPFAGLAFFGYWAVETGITLAPASAYSWVALIPHSLTVLIELQAYVLFLLGAWLLGMGWIRPRTFGETTRRRGYVRGLRSIGTLAIPAFVLLVIGAVWEAYSLRYFVHPLAEWLL